MDGKVRPERRAPLDKNAERITRGAEIHCQAIARTNRNRAMADRPNTIVIILTSYDTPEYREAAGKAKANYFLAKGSSSKESILTLVESILAGRRNPASSRQEGRGDEGATQ